MAYYDQGMDNAAVFEFCLHKLPENRNFLLTAVLEQELDCHENLHSTLEE